MKHPMTDKTMPDEIYTDGNYVFKPNSVYRYDPDGERTTLAKDAGLTRYTRAPSPVTVDSLKRESTRWMLANANHMDLEDVGNAIIDHLYSSGHLSLPAVEERGEIKSIIEGIKEQEQENSGFWNSCSGCHETNEGYPTGPYSKIFKCHLGLGCSECGGVGAVWDNTDYEEMAKFFQREEAALSSAIRPDWEAVLEGMKRKYEPLVDFDLVAIEAHNDALDAAIEAVKQKLGAKP